MPLRFFEARAILAPRPLRRVVPSTHAMPNQLHSSSVWSQFVFSFQEGPPVLKKKVASAYRCGGLKHGFAVSVAGRQRGDPFGLQLQQVVKRLSAAYRRQLRLVTHKD